ncbi:MAG: hypothetical protein ACOH2V_03495 [Candidatus Saccharimonadaceae bacterium]
MLKIGFRLMMLSLIIFSFHMNAQDGKLTKKEFQPDTVSLIRNPGMGWTVYDDASDAVANAEDFWQKQDTVASKYATTLYIRWRWTDMEPEEGKYAWNNDDNFKKLVKGATDRGLKLAFRVYMASQDNEYESTPAFVFDAGAKYYMESGKPGKVRSPYPDDLIFREKFENFIKAFAAEFDDPSLVNYVDGYNIGWWGEGHNLQFLNRENSEETFAWIINLYGNQFKRVPLVITIDSQIGHDLELKYAIDGQGYAVRRDGYASFWMPESQKKLLQGIFPKAFVVAECCYWQDRTIESVNKIDQQYDWESWGDYYTQVVDEALDTHANYLDLREPVEAIRWAQEANEDVKRFMIKGGYRIYPTNVAFTPVVNESGNIRIDHSWKNLGVGVLPNNNKRWNHKYKLAFALVDKNNSVVKQWVENKVEVSDWIGEKEYSYSSEFKLEDVKKGKYSLAMSIIDTQQENGEPIKLAIANKIIINESWTLLGPVTIKAEK